MKLRTSLQIGKQLAGRPTAALSCVRLGFLIAGWRKAYGRERALSYVRDFALVASTEWFDAAYYRARYLTENDSDFAAVKHYVEHGAWAGHSPSPGFDGEFYLGRYPDVASADINPLVHYLLYGQLQGRVCTREAALASDRSTLRFDNLEEYLRLSMTYHELIVEPFNEVDKRVLATLDSLRRHRAAKERDAPRSALVSVILPTRNRADVLMTAVESVLGQSYENLELIVIDDAGTDATASLVEQIQDSRVKFVRRDNRGGAGVARNDGLEAANGQLIAYMDSDGWWHPDFLLLMVALLRGNPECEFGYSAQEVIRHAPGTNVTRRSIRYAPYWRSLLENRNYIDMISVLHTRRLCERSGGFNPELRRFVDWELFLRYTANNRAVSTPLVLSHTVVGERADSVSVTEAITPALRVVRDTLMAQPLDSLFARHRVLRGVRVFSEASAQQHGGRIKSSHPVTIVIPSYEASEYLDLCLDSITRFSPEAKVIVVDNDSGPSVDEVIHRYSDRPEFRAIKSKRNLGFTGAARIGMSEASSDDDIVLLNNDALVTPGWLSQMQDVAQNYEECGLVVPRQVLPAGTPTIQTHVPSADTEFEMDVNLSAHHQNVVGPNYAGHPSLVEVSFAPFFCVYIPRRTIDAIGPLDESMGAHYRSDRVYCQLVRSECGARILYTSRSKVYHFLQKATEDLQKRSPDQFQRLFVANQTD